jgi:hypothetical protein
MFTTQILHIIVIFVVPFICFIHFFNLVATHGHSPSMVLSIEQNGCLPLYRCRRCLIHWTWTPSSVCWWPSINSYLTCNSYNHIDDMIILYNDIIITTHHSRIVPRRTACLDPSCHAMPNPAVRVRCMWHTSLHFSTSQKVYTNFTF